MAESSLALARLRHSLEQLEPRRARLSGHVAPLGHAGVDAALGGGLPGGRLHEIFASAEDAGSGAGIAALLGLRAGAGRPLLWLRMETAQRRAGRLHMAGLGDLGLDPAAMLLVLVPDEAALLHAAAESARCAGLGALLIEGWGQMRRLDLTASRRLMLAAEGSGVTVLLLRIAADPAPSAADTRWRVAAAPSTALEADAPGAPAFELELMRRRAGPPAGPWRLEWDRDRLCFRDPCDAGRAEDAAPAGSPLPRFVLPLVAGGTAGAGMAARRRTG